MADHNGASAPLINNLNTLQHAWSEFDAVLKQLPSSLAKHGFKLSVDLERPRSQISHELQETSEQALREVQQLRIQIDEDRVKQDVNSITESEYFQYLRSMAAKMRAKSGKGAVSS